MANRSSCFHPDNTVLVEIYIPGKGLAEDPSPPKRPLFLDYSEDIRRYYDSVKSFLQQHHMTGSLLKRSLKVLIFPYHIDAFKRMYMAIQKKSTGIWVTYESIVRYLMKRSITRGKESAFYYLKRDHFNKSKLKNFQRGDPFTYWDFTTAKFSKHFKKFPNLQDLEEYIKFIVAEFKIEDIVRYELVETRELLNGGKLSIDICVVELVEKFHELLRVSAPLIYTRYTTSSSISPTSQRISGHQAKTTRVATQTGEGRTSHEESSRGSQDLGDDISLLAYQLAECGLVEVDDTHVRPGYGDFELVGVEESQESEDWQESDEFEYYY